MTARPAWADDPRLEGLDVYRVGGAVRDELLGRVPVEHDFVVVGSGPDVLVERGFRPVGRDFPVFLHPDSGQEFALARTERKSGPGYRGFTFHTGPGVSLEDDLKRRDLTINAIAESRTGELVDPWGGRRDIELGVLRHVSDAFVEDPVRLLRLARFAARFDAFSVAPETLALCRRLVETGEVDHLVAERVWQEMARALMHDRPSIFIRLLRETGALARILPEVEALFGVAQVPEYHPEVDTGVHVLLVLDQAAAMGGSLAARFACLVHDLGKALTPADQLPSHHGHERSGLGPVEMVCDRFRVPNDCRELAMLVCEFHLMAHRALSLRPSKVVGLLHRLDAWRRPERFEQFLLACKADKRGRTGRAGEPYPAGDFLERAARETAEVDAAEFARRGLRGPEIGRAIDAERSERVAALRKS